MDIFFPLKSVNFSLKSNILFLDSIFGTYKSFLWYKKLPFAGIHFGLKSKLQPMENRAIKSSFFFFFFFFYKKRIIFMSLIK